MFNVELMPTTSASVPPTTESALPVFPLINLIRSPKPGPVPRVTCAVLCVPRALHWCSETLTTPGPWCVKNAASEPPTCRCEFRIFRGSSTKLLVPTPIKGSTDLSPGREPGFWHTGVVPRNTTASDVHTPAPSALVKRTATISSVLEQAQFFPRLRYMGSKDKLLPHLERTFAQLGGTTAVDAFSGSGVVSYLLKAQGFNVVSNDFMKFSSIIARATVENSTERLSLETVEKICGPAADDRDFIQTTYRDLYFTHDDLAFLDSAWSHIDRLEGYQRDIAISALVLSAARKQPRGVFTFTGLRYDDGRRDIKISLREHFRERVAEYNGVVFDMNTTSTAVHGDVFELTATSPDIVYLDPPYAPPKDDADYTKRYWFLEGLSNYWRGMEIMPETKTKKLVKKFTPFAYPRSIEDALSRTFRKFEDAGAIVLSYSSNALPHSERIVDLLREVKPKVEVQAIDHKYHFGTHAAATRRDASEFIFIGRD